MKDVMLDIETLGRKPGCTILSIGAVQFDPRGNGYGEKFYSNITIESCRAAGLIEEPETVAWWSTQSAEAKAGFLTNQKELANIAYAFSFWWLSLGVENVWCQGAGFDAPLMTEAFERVNVKTPWEFWAVRDTRTAYDLCGFDPKSIVRVGTYHHALDDCIHQIHCVQTAVQLRANAVK